MKVKIKIGKAKGEVIVPPSKSYAHRYLIGGMLSKSSKISHLSYSDDVLATLSCILSYGTLFQKREEEVIFQGEIPSFPEFDCYESGSTLRFFLPLALAKFDQATFIGSPRLIERGVSSYESCFKAIGINFSYENDRLNVKGKLKPGTYHLEVSKSSQYLTGLLFSLPLLDGDSTIVMEGKLSSKPYVDITLDVLRHFGILIEKEENKLFIKGNQQYQPIEASVEGDYSNAAPLDAWNYLGGEVSLKGLKKDSLQGDAIYPSLLKKLDEGYQNIDISNCIDLGPLLFAFASLKFGATFFGTSRLAIKESDRRVAMKEELEKLGAKVEIDGDSCKVSPIEKIDNEVIFSSHNDHRIAMALSLFASKMDIQIEDPACVSKSYLEFFHDLSSLGMEVIDE